MPERTSPLGDLDSGTPWGHKITLHVYVAGPPTAAELAIGVATNALDGVPGMDFIGAEIRVEQDEPRDQVAT